MLLLLVLGCLVDLLDNVSVICIVGFVDGVCLCCVFNSS